MRRFLELTMAGGKEIDLPYNSVLMFEQVGEGVNPHFPTARSAVRYKIGDEVGFLLLDDKVEDLVLELDINVRPDWLKLTKHGDPDDGSLVYVPSGMIMSREQRDESCMIRIDVSGHVKLYEVKETRRQIKKWSEPTPPPAPEGETA